MAAAVVSWGEDHVLGIRREWGKDVLVCQEHRRAQLVWDMMQESKGIERKRVGSLELEEERNRNSTWSVSELL